MNNKPNLINIVLIVAVAVLYYLHFSSSTTGNDDISDVTESMSDDSSAVKMKPNVDGAQIVYVNSDVLNEEYQLVKDIASTTLAEQQRLEMKYQRDGQKLQQDYAVYQQKISQGLLTTTQAMADQEDMKKRKAVLQQMEVRMEKLINEIQIKSEEVHNTVMDYVKMYNEKSSHNYILTYTERGAGAILLASDSLDVTATILEGLNAQYKESQEKKKAK